MFLYLYINILLHKYQEGFGVICIFTGGSLYYLHGMRQRFRTTAGELQKHLEHPTEKRKRKAAHHKGVPLGIYVELKS